METIAFVALTGLAGLFMATSVVVRGRRRGQSALKSLDENIVAFPGMLLPAFAAFFRHSMLALVLACAGAALIFVRLLFRKRPSAAR
jgi:hypothetical protein